MTTTRKSKRGLKVEVGDEVSFYQQGEVRTGTVNFVGAGFVTVYPCTAEWIGANGEPLKNIEHLIEIGDLL